MKDISLHLLDILENSAKAGATVVSVDFSIAENMLTMEIEDNGPGFPKEVIDDPVNPYSTTRKERKVGLGLSLLNEAAEQTGGTLFLGKSKLGGVMLKCAFNLAHTDCKPLGDIEFAFISAICAWPNMDWIISVSHSPSATLDTREIKKELDDIPINNPEVLKFISSQLSSIFASVKQRIEEIHTNFWRNF